jgi:hypothetical protein
MVSAADPLRPVVNLVTFIILNFPNSAFSTKAGSVFLLRGLTTNAN